MIPHAPTVHPSVELVMNTEFSPAEAEPTLFQPPPRPADPDQCQKTPETASTAHASVEPRAETDESFCAGEPERPVTIGNHDTPPH
jgi:hypothetical protein